MRYGLLCLSAAVLAASGCAVAPHGRGGQSVTHDVVDYLHREWPLAGPPVVPDDAIHGGCACCGGGNCQSGPDPNVYQDDWDQPGALPTSRGYTADAPPAVPLEPGPPGRFFPVPVRPAFAPRGGPTAGVIGPM